jgi:hypothetical protein
MRFLLHPQIASMFHWVFLKIQEEYTKKSESIMYNERRQIEAKYLATLGEAIVQCHTFSCLTAHGPLNQQYCESHKHASHLSKCSLASEKQEQLNTFTTVSQQHTRSNQCSCFREDGIKKKHGTCMNIWSEVADYVIFLTTLYNITFWW